MKPEKLRESVDQRWPGFPMASTQQLARAELGDRLLTAAVRSGLVLRLRRGVYVQSSYWHGLKPWDQDGLLVHVHHLSTGGNARYSHLSAARLHGCRVWDAGPLVHVTTGYANSRASAGMDVTVLLWVNGTPPHSWLMMAGKSWQPACTGPSWTAPGFCPSRKLP